MATNGEIYVLGGAQTDFARNWAREQLGLYDMFAEVLRDAVADAGIEPAQIEVGHVGNFVGDLFAGQGLIGGFFGHVYSELADLPTSRHEAACASGSIATLAAMRDIEAGHYQVACVLGIELMRNVDGKTAAEYLGAATYQGREALDCQYPWPHMFDLLTDEYDRRYGIDVQHLCRIGEINFANGRRNPNAQTRSWQFAEGSFQPDDALNPVIEGRVRKLDCGQVSDGAACIILAGREAAAQWAASKGLKLQDVPRIKGWGHRSAPLLMAEKLRISRDQPLVFPHVAKIFSEALQRAGMQHITEVDGLETHDCFTMTEYMAIDHCGLTPPGQSWQAIEEGRIAMDGDFPINPSGGLIGLGHPVGATGVRMVLDCSRQVSRQAGPTQLAKAHNMITFNVGGSATTGVSFVVGVGQ